MQVSTFISSMCSLYYILCMAHFGAKELDAKEAELEQLQPAEANS